VYNGSIKLHVDITISEQGRLGNLNIYTMVPSIALHPGLLRVSSWDYTQIGDISLLRSDTNN